MTLSSGAVDIERAVFVELFDNSVVNGYKPYVDALVSSRITFTDLVRLARTANIPYPLFFAPVAVVRAQVESKTAKLLQGLTKDSFSLNSRDSIRLADIELILKDLGRKQRLLRSHDKSLTKNAIIGLLRRRDESTEEQARMLRNALDLSADALPRAASKEAAVETLITHLEAQQILVSRSVQGFMPQRLRSRMSGITVKDPKVPYIFLARGDKGDAQEPYGRQLFTLTLLATLVARGVFAPVTYDGQEIATTPSIEYDIVGEFLMPREELAGATPTTLPDVRTVADRFKVTPSALAVRLNRLDLLPEIETREILRTLRAEHAARPKPQGRTPLPVNGVRTYNGRAFSSRMLAVHDDGRISPGEFCRAVCANRITPSQIPDLRAAL